MTYQQAYQRLNQEQRRAVEAIEGPVMVIAGPGTGKTQVLATRIAHIVEQTDTPPSAILALTFSEAAAITLQRRLTKLMGSTAYGVNVQTFHGFCHQVIQDHPEYFSLDQHAQPLTELELIQWVRQYLTNPELSFLRSAKSPYHAVKACKAALTNIKREGVSVEHFLQLVTAEIELPLPKKISKTQLAQLTTRRGKLSELADLYQAYQSFLAQTQRYDYDDMILMVLAALEEQPDLLAVYQERFLYFLVDEYQDTNSAQNQIIEILASFWGEQANVFVVSDPQQTIYRFQGASLENVLGFTQRYPQAEVIKLTTGYRCPQTVYDAAAHCLSQDRTTAELAPSLFTHLTQPLTGLKPGQPILVLSAATDAQEEATVMTQITDLISAGTKPSEIAILFKTNKEAQRWLEICQQWSVPYQLERRQNLLATPVITWLLELWRTIFALRQSAPTLEMTNVLLRPWFKLPGLAVIKLAKHLASKPTQWVELTHLNESDLTAILAEAKVSHADWQAISDVLNTLIELGLTESHQTLLAWIPELLQVTGFQSWLLEQHQPDLLQSLTSWYRYLKQLASTQDRLTLDQCLEIVNTMQQEGIAVPEQVLLGDPQGVVLSTAHSAKGQEWQHVFIVNCIDKHWGNTRPQPSLPLPAGILRFQPETEHDKNADDRRLFYVSLTRASEQAYISWSETTETAGKSHLMSQYVALLTEKDGLTTAWSPLPTSDTTIAKLLPVRHLPNSTEFRAWLKTQVSQLTLSPTMLDGYLKHQEEFLDQYVLRLPRAKTPSLAVGSAAHIALEYYYRHAQQPPTPDQVIDIFATALRQEDLTPPELVARLKQGRQMLSSYLNMLPPVTSPVLFVERKFGSRSKPIMLAGVVPLTGKVDRIDWLDQAKREVLVVDYKTGRVKAADHIEGKSYVSELSERERDLPVAIRGPLKRQLLFYKLIADLDPTFPYIVNRAELDFLEAAQEGKNGRRQFELLPADVDQLSQLLMQVWQEIQDLAFLS